MPTRLVREGILTSDRVDKLDAAAEVFYRRLMSKVDDYGLYDARLSVLRSSLYPLRVDRVREADISRSLAACQSAGLIALYQCDGKPYLQMLRTGWQARSEAKYPLPPTTENSCAQALTPAPVFVDVVVVESVSSAGKPARAGFDEFYAAYPRKVKPVDARKAWDKLKPDAELLARMLRAIAEQKKSPQWLKDGGQFIPYPATWLNAGEWDNQTAVDTTTPAVETWKPPPALTAEEQAAADEVRRRLMPALKRVTA